MELHRFLLNNHGRLRSGWRLGIFVFLFNFLLILAASMAHLLLEKVLNQSAEAILSSTWGWIAQAILIFGAAFGAGWVCARFLEGLPARSLGWALHAGAARDLLLGALIGIGSLLIAIAIATLIGGLRFSLSGFSTTEVARTLLISGLIFIVAAAAEETLFRGYPLQTMARARLAWVAVLLTSAFFARAHLNNPNIVPWFSFMNTALAGVWLAVAFLKTRSLWLPLGIHSAWNWFMGAVAGIPVSGISRITSAPLFQSQDAGPSWLTGGGYGIEGGLACSIALVISTLFIWRTRLVRISEQMEPFAYEPEEQRLDVRC